MSAFDDTGPLGNAEDSIPLSGMGTRGSPLPLDMPGTLSPIEGDGMFPPVGGNRRFAGGPQFATAGVSDAPMQLKAAIFGQESGNNPNAATSADNAQGLAQMIPETFAQYARPGEDIHRDSATVGGRAISDYYQRFGGDPARVAVAYFSGPGNVAPQGSPTPWIHDRADSNGKTVSSYVADITGRLKSGDGGTAMGQGDQAVPQGPEPPNLSPEEYRKQHNQGATQGLQPLLIAGAVAVAFLGVALGRKGHAGSMGAMAGLSGFVNGLAEGQEEKARQGLEEYKQWVDQSQKTYENQRQKTNDILANEKLSIDTKLEQLKVHAAETQNQKLYDLAVQKKTAEIDMLHAETQKRLAAAKKLADGGAAALGKFKFLTDDAINDLAEQALTDPEVLKGLGAASKTAVENRMAELKRAKAAETAKAPTRKPDERSFFSRHLPTFLGGEPDPNAPAPAPRSGEGPPTASALPPGYTQEKALDEARQALAKGASREEVAARLKGWGIDPALLESDSDGPL